MISRFKSLLGRLRPVPAAPPVAPPPPSLTLAEELRPWEQTVADFTAKRRGQPGRLYSSLPADRARMVATKYPEQARATVAAAERVCRHEFDLLGSGPFVPRDPGRAPRGAYQPIDWYLDPIQQLRFPERVPHKQWNLLEMRPGLADVKLPWELGRCQHWMPLAQAFATQGNVKYAVEILDQHDDFMEANPVGLGIQWTCTMDVAIRALNWAMALELIQSDERVAAERIERMYASLFDHGTFIERNLENTYEVTSNHFLSNVVGLYGLGLLFSELPSGGRWLVLCRGWLEQEMRVQVLPDGCDYESSIPYHRLVAELFLSGWRIAASMGLPLSDAYGSKLRSMIEFLDAVLRPDGKLPQVGDADDGRVHVFSDYGRWNPQDARHLLSPAAAIFERPEWMAADDAWAGWEASWWGVTPAAATSRPLKVQRVFPDAGIVVMRDARDYLLVSNGKVGTNGFGNHKHNDLLSFEFHQSGVALIVDPGSYVYTSNPPERNRFRSTSAHNTLVVDEEEQNEFKSEWLFRMFEKARPEHITFEPGEGVTTYRGRHDGYTRLSPPVMHEREWRLDHVSGTLTIADEVRGDGRHRLRWTFQCAPGVVVTAAAPGTLALAAAGRTWRLRADPELRSSIESGWYSPSYGVREPAAVIRFAADADLAKKHQWSFVVEAER